METIYLALGANIGDREENLRQALRLLPSPELRITRVSPVYETAPLEVTEQPSFLNAVAQGQSSLSPRALLTRCQFVERSLGGRDRPVPKGPRTVDIDVLLVGDETVAEMDLEVPHPRMTERRFVLQPLVDLAPELRHPVTRVLFRDYLAATSGQFVRLLPLVLG